MDLNDRSLFRQKAYIDGQWMDARNGATIDVANPATGDILGTVPKMGAKETEAAIEAAQKAFQAWKNETAATRSAIVRRWCDLLLEHCDDLALIMTMEQGKPLAEAKGEVVYSASFLEWFAEEAKRTYGEVIPAQQIDKRIVVIKQPVGVVGAITPWNFPAAMIARKAAPALAAGCTFVCKPASATPFTALALAELGERAGLPKGCLNVLTGSASAIGDTLTSHPEVRKISFTGSTDVGKKLLAQAAGTIKKVSLELGGNAPFVVFDDADVDAAVEGALISKYRNTGQTCVCTNRFYVQTGIYDAFVGKLTKEVKQFKVGPGTDDQVTQGPLIDRAALEKVEEHLADALGKGAKLVTGGKRHALGGTFFEPTIISNATPQMKVAHEETFGPLAPIFQFDTEEEAITMANDTPFGLAAYFYTRNLGRAWRVAEQMETGMVGINSGLISTEVAPFGGVKESGIGREGSRYGMEEYLEIKYLCMGGI